MSIKTSTQCNRYEFDFFLYDFINTEMCDVYPHCLVDIWCNGIHESVFVKVSTISNAKDSFIQIQQSAVLPSSLFLILDQA